MVAMLNLLCRAKDSLVMRGLVLAKTWSNIMAINATILAIMTCELLVHAVWKYNVCKNSKILFGCPLNNIASIILINSV